MSELLSELLSEPLKVTYETTPNPQSMKFIFSKPIAEEIVQFDSTQACQRSPLATKIFGFPWAAAVMIGKDFVTITKQDWVEWDIIAEHLANLLQEHIQDSEPVLLPKAVVAESSQDSAMVVQIKKIFNEEIRPAVAMDGGDIVFHCYEEGRVYVHLHGACSGCPGATATLKEGVEARLKSSIPEITEVIAL